MRLGVIWDSNSSAAYYRAFAPMRLMEQRGHHVVWPSDERGDPDIERLAECEVVHAYRRLDVESQQKLRELAAAGVAITWDNDDDLAALPRESPRYGVNGGSKGEALFRRSVRAAKLAARVTVPTETLAARYRQEGVPSVTVIPNAVSTAEFRRRRPHAGILIGWVAGQEHRADLVRLPIVQALTALQAGRVDVHVESIGLDLGLEHRYRHRAFVPLGDLPEQMARFDIGIAPLADIPFNLARSDIKVKEYAASGVAWLASDLAPYGHLGPSNGGDLVPADGWLPALERLVGDAALRRLRARAGRAWARTQTIHATGDLWEATFREAAGGSTDVL